MQFFRRTIIAGTAVWCLPLGSDRSREVSIEGLRARSASVTI